MMVEDVVVMDRGRYKNRPGVIVRVSGDKCTVVLTDTPNYPEHADVTIYNVTSRDYHKV